MVFSRRKTVPKNYPFYRSFSLQTGSLQYFHLQGNDFLSINYKVVGSFECEISLYFDD